MSSVTMATTPRVVLVAVVTLSFLEGCASFCAHTSPLEEMSYTGAYTITFPDLNQHDPNHCSWLLVTYKTPLVNRLIFEGSMLGGQGCGNKVTVYDGPSSSDHILATLCDDVSTEIVTSQHKTLVVFSSVSGVLANSSFTLRYSATKARGDGGEAFHKEILKIAFGVVFFCLIMSVVGCWGHKRYKHKRSRVTAAPGTGPQSSHPVTSSSVQDRRSSLRKRVTLFFQGVIARLGARPVSQSAPSTSESSEARTHAVSYRRYAFSLTEITNAHYSSSTGDEVTTISEVGHENFGYQAFPVSSFTSDPSEVKPPPYEACLTPADLPRGQSTTQGGSLQFNIPATLSSGQTASPPPPYTENVFVNPAHKQNNMSSIQTHLNSSNITNNSSSITNNSSSRRNRLPTIRTLIDPVPIQPCSARCTHFRSTKHQLPFAGPPQQQTTRLINQTHGNNGGMIGSFNSSVNRNSNGMSNNSNNNNSINNSNLIKDDGLSASVPPTTATTLTNTINPPPPDDVNDHDVTSHDVTVGVDISDDVEGHISSGTSLTVEEDMAALTDAIAVGEMDGTADELTTQDVNATPYATAAGETNASEDINALGEINASGEVNASGEINASGETHAHRDSVI